LLSPYCVTNIDEGALLSEKGDPSTAFSLPVSALMLKAEIFFEL
jgi:hypothetical protein